LNPAGGTSVVSARVEDTSGLGVSGIPVNFSTDNGSLSAASALTDANGVASVTLTTSRTAKVTASVAGKTADVSVALNPRTGVNVTAPTGQIAAGQAASFTIEASSDANIQNVVVEWGDGSSQNLGTVRGSRTVSHTYQTDGTYEVRATATDASGFSEFASTSIRVLPAQPPTVTLTASNNSPTVGEQIQITANVQGNTSSIIRYEWTFGGPCADRPSQSTASNRVTISWSCEGSKTVSVRVIQASGPEGDNLISITVRR
jgi:adhesin/invasin